MAELRSLLKRASDLSNQGDVLEARRMLAPGMSALGTTREFAILWLELARFSPFPGSLVQDCESLSSAFGHDPEILTLAGTALSAFLTHAPRDVTIWRKAVFSVVRSMDDILARMPSQDPQRSGLVSVLKGLLRFGGPDLDQRAIEAFKAAIDEQPSEGARWADLALLYKELGRYEDSFACGMRARTLLGDVRPVLFNLAIAATATRRGPTAVELWHAAQIPAQPGPNGLPVVEGIPPAFLRVPTRGTGFAYDVLKPSEIGIELVSLQPISPCHGVVTSPVFQDGPIDVGDVVLFDAAPAAWVHPKDEEKVPAFLLLGLLHASRDHRFRFVGLENRAGAFNRFREALLPYSILLQDPADAFHSCPRCDAGVSHEHQSSFRPQGLFYGKVIFPAQSDLHEIKHKLEELARQIEGFAVSAPGLYEALADTKAAGQAHLAWKGIEKRAQSISQRFSEQ